MSSNNPPVPSSATKKEVDPLAQIQAIAKKLTPEQREGLRQAGMVVPEGDLSSILARDFKWGLRCTGCNRVALYFVGVKWDFQGRATDVPPAMPHWDIMWTQNLPVQQIDRSTPKCQHCQREVPLNQDGSFQRTRGRIVRVAEWEHEVERTHSREYVEKVRRDHERLSPEAAAAASALPTSYNQPDVPVSRVIEEQRGPGALEEIEAIASLTGADQFKRM